MRGIGAAQPTVGQGSGGRPVGHHGAQDGEIGIFMRSRPETNVSDRSHMRSISLAVYSSRLLRVSGVGLLPIAHA